MISFVTRGASALLRRTGRARTAAVVAATVLGSVAVPIALAPAASASESVLYVAAGGDDTGGNTCAVSASPCASVSYALTQAASGATINVTGTIADHLTVNQDVTITGENAPVGSPAVIDGGSSGTIVSGNSGNLTIDHLTLQHGNSTSGGTGGGAVHRSGGDLTMTHVTVASNASNSGGGGMAVSDSTLTISDSTFTGNVAAAGWGGGAILLMRTEASISDTTFSGNSSSGGSGVSAGGAILVGIPGASFAAGLTLVNSTVTNNDATSGAGIYLNASSTANITTSTLSGNTGSFGTALYSSGGTATVLGSTLAGNGGTALSGANITLGASIVADNHGVNCASAVTSAGYNLSDDASCAFTGTGDVNNEPSGLGALADHGGPTRTMALSTSSPAASAVPYGTSLTGVQVCPRTDQTGSAGPSAVEGGCSMGAVEAVGAVAPANTRYVAAGGVDAANDCASAATPCATVSHALTEASPLGLALTVEVSGTIHDNIVTTPAFPITITGADAPASAPAVIDGSSSAIVLRLNAGTVLTLDHLTVQHGSAPTGPGGGGIYSYSSTLTLDHARVQSSQANLAGGGILAVGGSLTVRDSAVTDNTGDVCGGCQNAVGGGIAYESGAVVHITNSTISGNSVGSVQDGGGIGAVSSGSLVITGSTISGNSAGYRGGGIAAGSATITNSTLSGNTAGSWGGAIYDGGGQYLITDSTIADNVANDNATIKAAGLYIEGAATVTLGASVLAGNAIGNCASGGTAVFRSAGYNLDDDGSCALTDTGDVSKVAAGLGALVDNGGTTETMLPSATSPAAFAIPAGTTLNSVQVCPRLDQRGFSGPVAGHATCTIGAVEVGTAAGTAPMFTSTANRSIVWGDRFSLTVTTSGTPAIALSVSPATPLPTGVTFTDNGDGTGTLAGFLTRTGTSTFTLRAANGTAPDATQVYTLTGTKRPQPPLAVTSLTGTPGTPLALTTSGGAGTGPVTFTATDGNATGCTVSATAPSTLSVTAAGTCSVTASKASDNNYTAISSHPATVTIGQGPQAPLRLTSPSGTVGRPLTLTASGGSGTGAVTFSTTDGTATGCAVTARAPYTLIASSAGTCTVTATKAGDSADRPVSSTPTPVTLGATPPSPPLGVNRTQRTAAGGFGAANGVAVDAAGSLFVVDKSASTIVKITAAGVRSDVGSGLSGPSGIAVDSAGNVYVADTGNARVVRITPQGGQTTIGSGFTTPVSVAVDGAGNVYVTDTHFRNVSEITAAGDQFAIGSGFSNPVGVAVDQAGNVYVTDANIGNVSQITPAGGQSSIGSGFSDPVGVAVDAAGNVYVTDLHFQNVSQILPSGSQSGIASGFGAPVGVAVDPAGNVYVADSTTNDVYELVDAPAAGPSAAGSATITWAPPLFAGGETVTRYTATAADATSAANGGQTCTYTVTAPETDTCTVNGLTPGDSYTFTVTASSTGGTSRPSNPSNPVTATKAAQASLTITSTSGVYGTPLALTTSGGSGSGAITFTVADGTATGCVVSVAAPYTLTSASPGSCTVTATKAGDGSYSAISSAPTAVTLGLAAQAPLTLTSTSGTFGTPLRLLADGGSGTGVVTYDAAEGTASGCAITGIDPYTLGAATAGTCIVTATRAGDATYAPKSSAPTTVTLAQAAQAPLVITSTTGPFGSRLGLSTSGGSGSGAVTFTAADGTATDCAVSGGKPSTLTSASAGTCIVTATKSGDVSYTAVSSAPTTITLYKANQAPLNLTSTRGTAGSPLTLVASGGSSTGAVSFSASDGTAGGCLASGSTLTTTSSGTCIVTAVKAGDAYYQPVSSAPTAVTFVSAVPSPPLGAGLSGAVFASGFSDPQDVTTDVDGNVYVADRNHNQIVEYSPAGAALHAISVTAPMAVAVDAQGVLYVAQANAGQILKIGTDGTQTHIGGGFADPEGIAVDAAGNVYVTDDRYSNLSKIEPNGTQIGMNSFSSGPKGVTTDAAGNVYVVNPGASQVLRIQPDGTTSQYGPSFPDPRGVAIDGSGNLYVGDVTGGGTLYVASPAASRATLLATSLGGGDVFLALGPDGELYVSIGSADVVGKFVRAPQSAAVGATSASVTWAPPAFPAGTIVSYTATATDATTAANGGQSCSYTVADPESDTCTVTGLTTGDSYTFTVTAKTSLATSPPSAPTNAITLTAAKSDQTPLVITSTSGTFGTDLVLTTSGGSGSGVVTFDVASGTATGCAVSGPGPFTLTSTSAGTCTVTATKAADVNYLAASSGATFVRLGKATQATLTLTSTSGTFGIPLTLTTSGGSGTGAVSFVVSDGTASGCTLDGVKLRVTSVGTCVVTATEAADGNYTAASSDPTTVAFGKAAQAALVVNPASGPAPLTLTTTGGSGTGALTYSTIDGTAVGCAVDGSSLTATAAGTCSVTATKAADHDYTAVSSDATTVTLSTARQAITFAPLASPATVGSSQTLSAAGGGSGNAVTFSVDATTTGSACSISGTRLSFDHAGTCVVDADQAGDGNYAPAPRVQQTVSVGLAPTTVAVTLHPASSVYGQRVTASAATPASVSGTVQFTLDGTDLGSPVTAADGTADSGPLGLLAPGDHQVGARFVPSDTSAYSSSSADPQSEPVTAAATATVVAVTSRAVSAGVAVLAPGAGTPSGAVTFSVDGRAVGSAALQAGTATLSYQVPSGMTQRVTAVYAGATDFLGSSDSTSRQDPSITARVTSAHARTRYSWYRSPVTVSFTCTTHGAALTTACPRAVTLSANRAGQSVTRTITATDGGVATVTVSGINIDRTAPTVQITGISTAAPYLMAGPRGRCVARDTGSGLLSCRISTRTRGWVETYRATATDRAGNVRIARRSVLVAAQVIAGAHYSRGTYTVRLGHTYTLEVVASQRPRYVDATPYPRRPWGEDRYFHAIGYHRWALGVTFTKSMHRYTYWNVGIRVGAAVHVVRVRVVR